MIPKKDVRVNPRFIPFEEHSRSPSSIAVIERSHPCRTERLAVVLIPFGRVLIPRALMIDSLVKPKFSIRILFALTRPLKNPIHSRVNTAKQGAPEWTE